MQFLKRIGGTTGFPAGARIQFIQYSVAPQHRIPVRVTGGIALTISAIGWHIKAMSVQRRFLLACVGESEAHAMFPVNCRSRSVAPGTLWRAPLRILVYAVLFAGAACAAPEIFPQPRQVEPAPGSFLLDATVAIALPPGGAPSDRALAAFLAGELAGRFQLALQTVPLASLAAGQRSIVMGSVANPWVRNAAARFSTGTTCGRWVSSFDRPSLR